MPAHDPFDLIAHNQAAWDQLAAQDCEWSRPVTPDVIAAARRGDWAVRLTPGPLPAGWLDQVKGLAVLCLASAGGQQAPVLAAAGAEVTVFDLSERQLAQDRAVASRDGLALATVQGDMRDLSAFADQSFDVVFHPISNLYVPDVRPVWRECFRVLRPGGSLLSSFYNPVVFVGDRDPRYARDGLIRPVHALPYADTRALDAAALDAKRARRGSGVRPQPARPDRRPAGRRFPAGGLSRRPPAAAALPDRPLRADVPGDAGGQAGAGVRKAAIVRADRARWLAMRPVAEPVGAVQPGIGRSLLPRTTSVGASRTLSGRPPAIFCSNSSSPNRPIWCMGEWMVVRPMGRAPASGVSL